MTESESFSHESVHYLPKRFAAPLGVRYHIFYIVIIIIFCEFLHIVYFITLLFEYRL